MRFIFILFVAFLFFSPNSYSSYLAEVIKDKINIRTDSTVMSSSLGYLDKGEKVVVLEERYSWCKIVLSPRFTAYAYGAFLKKIDKDKAEVIASSLNLRSKPSLKAPIIGRVRRRAVLQIIEKDKDWYKVKGYPYLWGWVYKRFLKKVPTKE
jgi:uncharacterized protein YgiM (DUF1202 family)